MDKSLKMQTDVICDSLRKTIKASGSRGVLVDLDGGVASAVAAALAQKAVGRSVSGLIMTCHNREQDLDDAHLVATHLGLDHRQVDLSPLFGTLVAVLPGTSSESERQIKSHLKMIVLRHFAFSLDYLALGTTTRSDWEIGLAQKHGETEADLFPLQNLLKSHLYNIARYLKLPDQIIDKPLPPIEFAGIGQAPASTCTYFELDSYLSGNLTHVKEEVRSGIQTMLQAASRQRQLLPGSSSHNAWMEKDSPLADDYETYDKSIEALTLISKAITSDQYLEDILRLIVMVTAEIMNSSVCSLWLVDEKEGALRLRATQSIDKEYLKDRVLKMGEGVVGKVVNENRPYAVPDVLKDSYFKEKDLARRMGLVSMLGMPMRVKDRVIGVINCYTSHPHTFTDLQTNVLTAVANQAAVAIEKTELMVQTKVIQEELEKRKIIERAKDLLMKRLALSGEEAYRWLQKRSMNTRKSMREVSEAVLLTMEG